MKIGETYDIDNLTVLDCDTDKETKITGRYVLTAIERGDSTVGIFGDDAWLTPSGVDPETTFGYIVDADTLWQHVDPEGYENDENWGSIDG